MTYAIEAERLSKRYRSQYAVKNLNLRVSQGVVFGMLGPNGAGKSTTLGMLTTLLRPTSGTARVAGLDVMREPRAVRAAVGIVFQEEMIDQDLTVRANLDLHARLHHISRADRPARIKAALQLAGLTDRAASKAGQLSGGLRRRLEIARGLMHTPQVLFLDEPTVGLDIESRRSIWREVRALRKRGDVTIVLTTHYLEEADELCDIVAIVDRGAVRAQGSPDELKRTLGGDVVRARLDAPTSQLKSALGALPGVRGVEVRDGNVLCTVTGGEEQTPKLFAVLQEHSSRVRSFRVEPPSLDDVFLQVTGRTLRDQDAA